METEVRTGSAVVARTAEKNPMSILYRFVSSHPTADVGWLFRKWRTAIIADEDLHDAVLRHTFTNLLSSIDKPRQQERRRAENIQRSEQIAAAATRTTERVIKRVTEIVLMDLLLPNGKTLRDATFKECAQAGGFFHLVAKKGRPLQIVGKTLTEDDLKTLYAG